MKATLVAKRRETLSNGVLISEADMAGKAIISVTDWGATKRSLKRLARRLDKGGRAGRGDYHLGFADSTALMTELSPARTELLRVLSREGPMSVYVLAKRLGRAYSNVHADVARLSRLELVAKNAAGKVSVPWKDVVIRVDSSILHQAA